MRGVRQIVRLNWPLYAVAAGIVGVAELGASGLRLNAGLRMAVQWGFYSSALWRGQRFNIIVHHVFSALWVYLTAVFAAALWMNLQ